MLNPIKKHKRPSNVRILIYGGYGIGKTYFGVNSDNPVFIRTEDGLGRHEGTKTFDLCETSEDIFQQLRWLYKEEHPYRTVVIDSLSVLDSIIRVEVDKEHTTAEKGYGKDQSLILDKWLKIIGALSFLYKKGMNIILITHADVKKANDPRVDPYDYWSPRLSERASGAIQGWVDCTLFITDDVFVRQVDAGFNKKLSKGIIKTLRVLYAQGQAAFVAKNRLGLPSVVPCSFMEIMEMLEKNRSKGVVEDEAVSKEEVVTDGKETPTV